ncbi:MAG: ATP-binding protein, partial [Myxococcales bacterium]
IRPRRRVPRRAASREAANHLDTPVESPAESAAAPASILLVDDKDANLLALEAVLAPLGQRLVKARSGAEALRHLLFGEFALILMDVQMPELDGLETARIIRTRERTRHVPIIFITALSREASWVMKGYSQGAVDYLLKPIDPEILRSKASVFVELWHRGQQLERQARELARRKLAEHEARRAAELREQLLAIVGHDIRSPLSAVLAASELLVRKFELEPEQRALVDRIVRNGERIESLVALLMDFTRAKLGQGLPVETAPGDLTASARRVTEDTAAAHPDRRFHFDAPGPLFAKFDADRLGQALLNLLENAVRYGAPEGAITVRLRGDDVWAVLDVHNHGAAIPPDAQRQIFEPFRRGELGHAHKSSLGLGLFIVREILRAHRGDVSVRSDRVEGTTFTLRLPRAPAPGAENEPMSAGD